MILLHRMTKKGFPVACLGYKLIIGFVRHCKSSLSNNATKIGPCRKDANKSRYFALLHEIKIAALGRKWGIFIAVVDPERIASDY